MQIQDFYVKTYYRIIGQSFFLKPVRLFVRTLANYHLKLVFKMNRRNHNCTGKKGDVIVSLTSFPARIYNLWLVIESLLRQSVKPQKIVIWLSKEQFTEDTIPQSLREIESRGVEIRLVDGDIRSHKKYYYVFQEHPNDLIMFADDDIIYPSDLIESLLLARTKCKSDKCVSHKYGYRMKWDNQGHLLPYKKWGCFYGEHEGNDLFFGSGGGTLLRPCDLYSDVTNIDLALRLCPKADDIWLNAMAKIGGCEYRKVKDGPILSVQNKNDVPLYKENLRQNQNDIQLEAVMTFYSGTSFYNRIFCNEE